MTMKWYKFIIYFQLFAAALINFFAAITYLTGSIYQSQAGVSAELTYSVFPQLSAIDKFYGICLIGLAVMAIITRNKLAKFRTGAPTLYYIFLIASLVVGIIYMIGVFAVIGEANFSSVSGSIVSSCVLLAINVVYFGKRQHLFVN